MQQLDIEKCLHDLESTGWTQLIHDRDFHKDIDCLNSKDKLYHLTLHLGKYTPNVIDRDGQVNYKTVADIFIIATSMANAMRIGVKQTWSSVLLRNDKPTHLTEFKEETLYSDVMSYMAITVSNLCKVCESLDHLESVNPRQVASSSIDRIFHLIFTLWVDFLGHDFDDLLKLVCRRLLAVEMHHPYYLYIKREQERVAKPIAIREYVELPMHETTLLKTLSTDDWKKYNKRNSSSLLMVMATPALISLERKGFIQTEVNGLFTLTVTGKKALQDIV